METELDVLKSNEGLPPKVTQVHMRDANDHKKGLEKPSLKPFSKARKNMYLDALHKHGIHNNAPSQELSASKPWMLHLNQKCQCCGAYEAFTCVPWISGLAFSVILPTAIPQRKMQI